MSQRRVREVSIPRRALWGLFAALAAACAARPEPANPAGVEAALGSPLEPPPNPPPPLRPLTADEQRLEMELRNECGALTALGPRSLAHSWNLHSATDDLARKLEMLGYEVVRQGFPVGDEILQNLEVVVPGTKSREALVIAAH